MLRFVERGLDAVFTVRPVIARKVEFGLDAIRTTDIGAILRPTRARRTEHNQAPHPDV
jgi:hypothetical protein